MMPNGAASLQDAAVTGSAVQHGKYLTLFLGAEEYGVEVMKVQEIIRMLPITRVPRAPAFVRGVINLRGRILPVLELRARFGMPSVEEARGTCIVVVRAGDLLMGIIVDQVRDVLDIRAEEIQPVPDFGVSVDTAYLKALARRDDRVVLLLNIECVLTSSEATAIGRTVAADEATTEIPDLDRGARHVNT
jgi:purine-binding chemotaxis protein CheW